MLAGLGELSVQNLYATFSTLDFVRILVFLTDNNYVLLHRTRMDDRQPSCRLSEPNSDPAELAGPPHGLQPCAHDSRTLDAVTGQAAAKAGARLTKSRIQFLEFDREACDWFCVDFRIVARFELALHTKLRPPILGRDFQTSTVDRTRYLLRSK